MHAYSVTPNSVEICSQCRWLEPMWLAGMHRGAEPKPSWLRDENVMCAATGRFIPSDVNGQQSATVALRANLGKAYWLRRYGALLGWFGLFSKIEIGVTRRPPDKVNLFRYTANGSEELSHKIRIEMCSRPLFRGRPEQLDLPNYAWKIVGIESIQNHSQ